MKNSLTKALLCGVMASTFFMINCQKAPSRGVKAQQGAGAATGKPAGADDGVAALKNTVPKCTDDFTKLLEEIKKSQESVKTNVKAADKTELSSDEISDLTAKRKELIEKKDALVKEMASMTKDGKPADGCGTGNNIKSFSKTTDKVYALIADIGKVTKATDAEQIAGEAAKKKLASDKNTAAGEQFAEGADMYLSPDAVADLSQENVNGVVYFKNGAIVKDSSFDAQKAEKNNTICIINAVTTGDSKLSHKESVKLMSISPLTNDATRVQLSFSLVQGGNAIEIKCLIDDSKLNIAAKLDAAKKQVRHAFGKNLQTKSEIDEKSADPAKTNLTTAKEALNEKEKALQNATSKVDTAQMAMDLKDKQIAEATADRDEAKLKKLKDEKETIQKDLDTLKALKDAAQKERDAAKVIADKAA